MALARTCGFCFEPLADCLCEDDEGTVASPPGTAAHAVTDRDEGAPPPYRGVIAVEWPAPGPSPYSAMPGCLASIFDAVTGEQIRTATRIEVHAAADGIVTADLTLFAGADGEPVLDGMPVLADGGPLTGTFPFVVSEMRVGQR